MSNTDICVNCFNPKKGFAVCPSCGWHDGAEPSNAYHLYPGSILRERYLVGMSVGFGGFGITYKAWDSKLGTIVAIKEFYPSGLVNRVPGDKKIVVYSGDRETQFYEQKKRFLDEARTMSKFTNHPNIVNVLDFFEENNTAYIVMEYLDGISVKKYLEQCGGKLEQQSAIDIILPILDALSSIHAKKIVHRDISPDNIFLTLDNRIKLLDLGAARLTNSEKEETLSVVIKPGFAPPEQYRSKSRQGAWTDIYGVGATLYKLLTGVTPDESIDRDVKETLKKPSSLGIKIDNKLERVIMKAMALKPELRFQSAQQMKTALLQQKEVDFPEDELKKRRVIRKILIAAVSVLGVGLITAVTLFLTVLKPEPTLASLYDKIEPATMTLCLPAEKESAFTAIIQEFNKQYNDKAFQIQATYCTDAELAAKTTADLPTIMATDSLSSAFIKENFLPLNLLTRSIRENDYVFLNQYQKLYPSMLEIPLGFEIATAYANTAVASSTGTELPHAMDASDTMFTSDKKIIIDSDNYDEILLLCDENAMQTADSGINVSEKSRDIIVSIQQMYAAESYKNCTFETTPPADAVPTQEGAVASSAITPVQNLADGKCAILLDDTSSFESVQASLAGYYKIMPLLSNSQLVGHYTCHFGVNKNASENEQRIAQLFLAYSLSDVAQNILHVQNSGNLPVHKRTLDTYTKINSDLAFANATPLRLVGENGRLYNRCNKTLESFCFTDVIPENPIVIIPDAQ